MRLGRLLRRLAVDRRLLERPSREFQMGAMAGTGVKEIFENLVWLLTQGSLRQARTRRNQPDKETRNYLDQSCYNMGRNIPALCRYLWLLPHRTRSQGLHRQRNNAIIR